MLQEERQIEASKAYGTEMIAIRDLAKLYELSVPSIRRMAKLKMIPPGVKYRGCWFWSKDRHASFKKKQDQARRGELKKVSVSWDSDKSQARRKTTRQSAEAA